MEIIYHGHSCIQIITDHHSLIIDPYISGNPQCQVQVQDIKVDAVLVTHGHNDHVGDALAICLKNDALLIANTEIADYFEHQGVRVHGLQPGGKYRFDFGVVKMTQAIHGSSYVDDKGVSIPMGIAGGFLVFMDDTVIYHAGDTALFSDMALYSAHEIDVAFVPIGDNYTMGIPDATLAVAYLKPKVVVPIHYNTFPEIEQDPELFASLVRGSKTKIMTIGENISVNQNFLQ